MKKKKVAKSNLFLFSRKHKKAPSIEDAFGAANQIRTDDLILTKDVLYQLSHSSIRTVIIIAKVFLFVKMYFA